MLVRQRGPWRGGSEALGYDGAGGRGGMHAAASPAAWVARATVALLFCATFVIYCDRVGFSVAFTGIATEAGVSKTTAGTVLSAFFYGYACTQVGGAPPATRRARRPPPRPQPWR